MRGARVAVAISRLVRPLSNSPMPHQHCYSHSPFATHLLGSFPSLSSDSATSFVLPFSSRRSIHIRSRGPRLATALTPSDFEDRESSSSSADSDSEAKKSRNQKKREAQRAFRWGMQLASFSAPQIKRILRVASLDSDVFDALKLVKRLGPDVREGKRRQFNYIGKLLREVKPELMDALIEATKDGNWSRVQGLSGVEMGTSSGDDEEIEFDLEEEGSHEYVGIATRWFDGLVCKDPEVTKEVYAVRNVDFDRQELRRLVRQVQKAQERKAVITEDNKQVVDAAMVVAKKSLTRFLRVLAKKAASESHIMH